MNHSKILTCQNPDGCIKTEVRLEEETVWLTQAQMAALFGQGRTAITEHIQNIFEEDESGEKALCRNFRHTTRHGAIEGKTQDKEVNFFITTKLSDRLLDNYAFRVVGTRRVSPPLGHYNYPQARQRICQQTIN